METGKLPIVILISGRGSNLQSIIDATLDGELPVQIRAVVSNRSDAFGLERARRAGITTEVIDKGDYPDRRAFDTALRSRIDIYRPRLVVLAGFMRILTPEFVEHYRGRMLNIHPALLPSFRGLDTHRRALEAGVREHGATVHFVTPEVDVGPVVLQAAVPVLAGDDADTLGARVLDQEHRIYPLAIRWFAEGRLECREDGAYLDGEPLPASGVNYEEEGRVRHSR